MSEIQKAVNEYFKKDSLNIDKIVSHYRQQNRVKLLDDTTKEAYLLDVNSGKLYIEKLKIK